MNEFLYVICGVDNDCKLLDSIERVNCNALIKGDPAEFEVIVPAGALGLKRCSEPLILTDQKA